MKNNAIVLMEHPPKQGLKQIEKYFLKCSIAFVLMEHPPKQGLKLGGHFRLKVAKDMF